MNPDSSTPVVEDYNQRSNSHDDIKIESDLEIMFDVHDLEFESLAKTWDEGIPLGNGMLGVLVWQKAGKLRLSLDRADLWDLRPMENLNTDKWKFSWVFDQWKKNQYKKVQDQFDKPYDQLPAPTKIPAGAIEFDLQRYGQPEKIRLHINQALCRLSWKDGKEMQTFVHATKPVGWFRIVGFDNFEIPDLIPPAYQNLDKETESISSLTGQNLSRLGYKQGKIVKDENKITYTQEGYGGFLYKIHLAWKYEGDAMIGVWSISSSYPDWEYLPDAVSVVEENQQIPFKLAFKSHIKWWQEYWTKSSVKLPEALLEKQWYLEMYKFGAAARDGAPPISLQAVWTADNGKIPPWKGDFHHDLNTELSYWPAYSGNHLDLETGFINWLWKYRETFLRYTRNFYGTNGLSVPGVTTLMGEPMGGWIQYSFGPTVSAWLGHHFYLHWRYTMNNQFLKEKAYPWIKDVAIHFNELSILDETGNRKLPISSSPEIFNNSREAWFSEITNYDLALIRWTFQKASELARELGRNEEAIKWETSLEEWPDYAVDENDGLMFSASVPYFESHRHFSHLMAIHPLGLIDISNNAEDKKTIANTIRNLDEKGPKFWTGYSYSWLGNLKARALDGEGAAQALRIFAEAFCLPNSFHVNGDQSGKGYSSMTYRPFTLEGNFAFAAGINEMLIQSHTGMIRLFPAIPSSWKHVEFKDLRAEGAFLVSSRLEGGKVQQVSIKSEQDGILRLYNPFSGKDFTTIGGDVSLKGDELQIYMTTGDRIILKRK